MTTTGIIYDIQRFSVNDGPGIRSTVFFKGCNYQCAWCHNPESISSHPELSFNASQCISCGKCVSVCPYDCHTFAGRTHKLNRSNCIVCGNCAQVCNGALEIIGKTVTAAEVLSVVLRDSLFYQASGGGMTVSGGEPFLQFDFLMQLLKEAARNGISAAIETNGSASTSQFEQAADYTDWFLLDYKVSKREDAKKYIGCYAEPKPVLELLNSLQKQVILRCPIIPGVNDTAKHFQSIADLADAYSCIQKIDLEPYHPFGIHKMLNLGKQPVFVNVTLPKKQQIHHWIESLQALTDTKVELA